MNEEEKHHAIKIMDKLMEHPITKIYYQIKSAENSENEVSPHTPNLIQIKSTLQDGEISFSEWVSQVNSVFQDESNFTDKQKKYHPIISKECKTIFEKLLKQLNNDSVKDWCSNIYRFHSEQIKLASHPPRSLFSIANQLDAFKKIDSERLIPVSNAEIKAFQQALTLVQSDDINQGLVNIVTELQPEIKPSNTNQLKIELYKLDLTTFCVMRDYLKAELEKQGDHYPT